MNKLELKEFRKKLNLTQTEFAKLFEKCKMRTVQNWESGNTPVPEHVELIIKRELEKLNTPFFVNENKETLNIVSESKSDYGLKAENLELKKIILGKDKQLSIYEKLIESLEEKIQMLEISIGKKKKTA